MSSNLKRSFSALILVLLAGWLFMSGSQTSRQISEEDRIKGCVTEYFRLARESK